MYEHLVLDVTPEVIKRCRDEVDPSWKMFARKLLRPLLKQYLRLEDLGEGFEFGLPIGPGNKSRIGRFVYLGKGFEANGTVIIGDLCLISRYVRIVGNDHAVSGVGLPIKLGPSRPTPVTVFEADTWVGKGATIRAGVVIGRGAVVGASSVVTSDVEPYSIVAGSPARIIRSRFTAEEAKRHDELVFGKKDSQMALHDCQNYTRDANLLNERKQPLCPGPVFASPRHAWDRTEQKRF